MRPAEPCVHYFSILAKWEFLKVLLEEFENEKEINEPIMKRISSPPLQILLMKHDLSLPTLLFPLKLSCNPVIYLTHTLEYARSSKAIIIK